MDNATALKIAQNYGVPPTPRNISLIMQEASGGNESAMLGRSMGMQGAGGEQGYDDSILKSKLDKLVADTSKDAPIKSEQLPPPEMPAAPAPAPRAAASAPVAAKNGPNASRQGNYGPANDAAPTTSANGGESSFMDWLMGAIGLGTLGAGAYQAFRGRGGNASTPTVPVEAPRLPNPMNPGVPGLEVNAMPQAIEGPPKMLALPAPQRALPAPEGSRGAPPPDEPPPAKGAKSAKRPSGPMSYPVGDNGIPLNAPESTGYHTPALDRPTNLDPSMSRLSSYNGPYDGVPTNLEEEVMNVLKKAKRVRR